jgi:hypothetical protein
MRLNLKLYALAQDAANWGKTGSCSWRDAIPRNINGELASNTDANIKGKHASKTEAAPRFSGGRSASAQRNKLPFIDALSRFLRPDGLYREAPGSSSGVCAANESKMSDPSAQSSHLVSNIRSPHPPSTSPGYKT